MESATTTGRPKLRKRSKSILAGGTDEPAEASSDGTVNLNGGNDETAKADAKTVSDNKDTGDTENAAEEKPANKKPAKGRKRKASEMKQDDGSSAEESTTKEKSYEEKEMESDVAEKESEQSEFQVDDKDKDESSANESSPELKILDKQSLGKGKRARIPNKRYSDFPLRSPKHGLLENGETKENFESGSNSDTSLKYLSEDLGSGASSPNANLASKARTSQTSSPSVPPPAKKPKPSINLSNPNYLKPFKFGWKRELVYRATGDSNKRNADIYYYTPNGKKVRSMREVSENLKNKELVIDDFTFFKEPLGLDDPEKEIIRDAKVKAGSATPAKKVTSKVAKTPKSSPKASSLSVPSEDLIESKRTKTPTQIKVKVSRMIPSNKAKAEKKPIKDKEKEKEKELEVATYPPNWSSPPTTKKAAKTKSSGLGTPTKKSKRSSNLKPAIVDSEEDTPFMEKYLQHVAYGYNTLLYVFQYLKVQDLLRASCVCAMWRDIASHPILWKTVRMKNSQIHNFEGLADALRKHNTTHLDLRKMLLPSNSSDDIWEEFSRVISKVESLKKVELCRCPATVVEQLAVSNPNLVVINAVTIKCESINLDPLSSLKNLQELRLKSITGFSINSSLTALSGLNQLKHLSLTSIKDLNKMNIEVIADLVNLESLDLGECADFPKTFGSEILSKLTKLEKLRLEKGQGNCYTFEMLDAVKDMECLEQLELVNFDIKPGFDKALGSCTNIKKLLIIPTYISQSATTNHMVLGGVLRLQSTLSHFVWGVTLELLRVTELFVDQCEDPEKKEKKEKKPVGNGDSIPVLKPVPLLKGGINLEILPAQDPPQVEILPLPNLQKLLLQSLPSTRVKILKIPFHATWRQSITDTVN